MPNRQLTEAQLSRISAGITLAIHLTVALIGVWILRTHPHVITTHTPVALQFTPSPAQPTPTLETPKPAEKHPASLPAAPQKPAPQRTPSTVKTNTQSQAAKPDTRATTSYVTPVKSPAAQNIPAQEPTPLPDTKTTILTQEATTTATDTSNKSTQTEPQPHPSDRPAASVKTFGTPVYPKTALNNDWEGVVEVRVDIEPDGTLSNITIIRSSGYDILDQSFIQTLKNQYEFLPKREFNVNTRDSIVLKYTFKID